MPIVLQARAERPFKKGTLVLSPLGAVELDDEATAYQLQRPKNRKIVHASMLRYAEASVGRPLVERRMGADHRKTYMVMSPLLCDGKQDGHKKCLQNLSPFWAVLGTPGVEAPHNMEPEVMVFREQQFASTCWPSIVSAASFQARVMILRNAKPIEKDEVLRVCYL